MTTKKPWALWAARRYARRALTRRFEGVYVDGLDATRAAAAAGPLLLCANHVSWWDAFVLVVVDEALGTDGRALMDDDNLQRLGFFRALGALPLSLRDPRKALSQLRSASSWLADGAVDGPLNPGAGRALWMFPQGRQVPSWRRPLGFHKSLVRVADDAGCAVVPVSLLVTWRERPEPAILVRLHPPLRVRGGPARAFADDVEARVADGIDALDVAAASGALPEPLVRGTARGADQSVGAKLLARAGAR